MSFIDKIPDHKKSLENKLKGVEAEILTYNMKLGASEEAQEFANHDCDCDYCPSREFDGSDVLEPAEIAELEKKRDDLENVKRNYEHTLDSLAGYAKLWGVKV